MSSSTNTEPEKESRKPGSAHDDKQATYQNLLDAAKHVFSRRGYRRMTMENVLAQANVSRPTLYKYFSSKAELVGAALDDEGKHLRNRLAEAMADPDRPLLETTRARLAAFYDWASSRRDFHRQLYLSLTECEPVVVASRNRFLMLVGQDWAAMLARAGLNVGDLLELEGLLHVKEQLSIRYFELFEEGRPDQRERFIESTLNITSAYLQQLIQRRAAALAASPETVSS